MKAGDPETPRAVLYARGRMLIPAVEMAGTLAARLRGLLGRRSLPSGQAMFLAPCRAVHTVGMRFSLDVVFLDRRLHVLRIARGVSPGRAVWGGWRAHGALELASGWLPAEALCAGEPVRLVEAR